MNTIIRALFRLRAYSGILVMVMLALHTNALNTRGYTMTKELKIEDIADWFLIKSENSMTHKKLQKICYYAMAWGYTLLNGRSIASNGQFEAWVHGPASPVLYQKYKNNGWSLIEKPTKQISTPDDIERVLEAVWITYGDKGGNELEALTHTETPWRNARVGLDDDTRGSNPIAIDDMIEYYSSIYKGDDR